MAAAAPAEAAAGLADEAPPAAAAQGGRMAVAAAAVAGVAAAPPVARAPAGLAEHVAHMYHSWMCMLGPVDAYVQSLPLRSDTSVANVRSSLAWEPTIVSRRSWDACALSGIVNGWLRAM